MIATIAVITEKKKKFIDRHHHSNHMETTFHRPLRHATITDIELFISQRSLSLRSLEGGFLMIAMITAIAELFFLSDRSDHIETRLKLRIFTE